MGCAILEKDSALHMEPLAGSKVSLRMKKTVYKKNKRKTHYLKVMGSSHIRSFFFVFKKRVAIERIDSNIFLDSNSIGLALQHVLTGWN